MRYTSLIKLTIIINLILCLSYFKFNAQQTTLMNTDTQQPGETLLNPKQQKFTLAISHLVQYADNLGYGLTYGAAWQDNNYKHGHRRDGCHPKRLAVDFNIFHHNKLLSDNEAHSVHLVLHKYWSTIGGADAIPGDLCHYSFEHDGMR